MPALKVYSLFISHAWKYCDDYYRLERLLHAAPLFRWRNYSVPRHDPLVDPDTPVGKKVLDSLLANQIMHANCVIVLGGMHAAYRYWISREIEIAQRFRKPIVAVYPRGQVFMPKLVQDAAYEIVNWNTDALVAAIRRIAL